METIFEKSVKGRRTDYIGASALAEYKLDDKFLSESTPELPEMAEVDLVRHYTELSRRAFGVDNGFYPLGSCTMKYNPKLGEAAAALPGFTAVHPLQDVEDVQGAAELMYRLGKSLGEITGMDAFALTPAAGAHGELTGLKIIKAYHESRGDFDRVKILCPDSAHGTNPASAALAGLSVVNIPSYSDGGVDLAALEAAAAEGGIAGLMLTNPNTLGMFEKNIKKIEEIVHGAGGLLYYDGANLNAIMGVARPGDMGFDVVHLNLHKTFATPHGGGGPGSGPVGCKAALAEFLPSPVVIKEGGKYRFAAPKKTIGRMKCFFGNFLVMVKAYSYILSLGGDGLKQASELAVLNANYLKSKLSEIDYLPKRYCMHEFVASLESFKAKTGVSALDVAKAMIDIGIHPPTMYFPLIVKEALMFEPTETESKETLSAAAGKILSILREAETDSEKFHHIPLSAPISRPDEVRAARTPILKADD